MSRPTVGIIGLGKVGQSLFYMLQQCNYRIGAVFNRTPETSLALAEDSDIAVGETPMEVVEKSELIILSVSDDVIPDMVTRLTDVDWTDKALIHVSGASSLDLLQVVRGKGAMVGSLHPAFPFADIMTSSQALQFATFAIEYSDNRLRGWLMDIIQSFDGHVLEIPVGKKAQYHLALVIASNYMVTLYAVAEKLLMGFTDDALPIHAALNSLMTATVNNLILTGTRDALTGPLARADLKTLQSHLNSMDDNPRLKDTYINLAKLSYPMLQERGIDITQIDKLFEENLNASDNT